MWGLGRASRPVLSQTVFERAAWTGTGTHHPPPHLTLSEDSGAGRCHRHNAVATVTMSEQDLRGSDLENMSLSKRFLQEGERGGVSRAQEGASGDQGLLRPEAAYVCLAHCSPQGEQGRPRLSCLQVWLPTTSRSFHTCWRPGSLSPSLLGHITLCPMSWPGLEAPLTESLSLNK